MARATTPSPRPVLLQPQAAPVDTYVQPARSGLGELADALGKFDRPLQEFIGARAEKQRDEDAIRGEAAFHKNNAVGYAEGVRQGLIPAQHSQAFMKAYKGAEGAALGNRIRSEYQAAWESWEGKNSDDPAAFDKFYHDFVSSRIGTEDPDILAGLMPTLRSLQGSASDAQTGYRSKQVYEGSLTAHLAGVNSTIDDANDAGLASGDGTNYTSTADEIEKQRAAFVASGGRATDFDEGAMNAIAGKAIELRDPKLLDFFDRKVPGESYTYGDTPYGSKLKQATTESLETIARQGIVDGDRAAEKERKAKEDAATRAAIDAMVAGEPVPEEVLKAGEAVDPEFRIKIGSWREGLANGQRDPALVRQVQREIMDGGGMAALIEAAPNITSADDLAFLHTFAKGFETSQDRIEEVMGSSAVRTIMDTIDVRTKGRTDTFDPVAGVSNEGLEAQYDFKQLMQRWVLDNPNATYEQTQDAIAKNSKIVLDRIKGYDEMLGEGTYERGGAETEGFDNPHTNGPPAEAEPPAEEQIAPAPTDDRAANEEFFRGLTPAQQSAVTQGAARAGISLDEAITKMRGGTSPAPAEGASVQPIGYRPPEDRPPADLAFLSSRAIQGAERPDSFTGMRPEFASGLEAMLRGAPPEIAAGLQVMSGYRSPQRQAELWAAALRKYGSAAEARKWVAPPGRSGHNHGHAADLAFNGVRLDKAPAHVREWVHANAAAYGLSFPLGNEAWHVELSGARNGKGQHQIAEGRRSFTREDAEAFLQAAMMTDPLDLPGAGRDVDGAGAPDGAFVQGDVGAGRLLDLIGQHESAGNYNAVFGDAGSERDLGQLTVNEIIRQQGASRRRGAESTAIGKYQFLRKTLVGLKDELGLSGEERFTPELQDRLAVALLERRGYRQFKAGTLSRRAFALRLAQEWSSLPDPRTGRSYYDGDGLNAASARTREVYAALGLAV